MKPSKPHSKKNVKNVVLPHTQAKLDLYRMYLEKYVNVLGAAQVFQKINIFDVFCGAGIYDDGKVGSPILAYEAIRQNRKWCSTHNKPITPISLTINDGVPQKVNQVEAHLNELNQDNICEIVCHNFKAEAIFEIVIREVNSKPKSERNLIFIDPYGYKTIRPQTLYSILQNGITELILFLPTSFLHRFAEVAQTKTEIIQYEHLRNFIFNFFPDGHPIRISEDYNIFDFIRYVKETLSFGSQFFTAAHYIQRDQGNYFAIFFITSNIYGLEKFLETKWELDPVKGQGFKIPKKTPTLFDSQFEEEDREQSLGWFATKLEAFLNKEKKNNRQVYEFTLNEGYLPKHAVEILTEWQKSGALRVWDFEAKKEARKGAFYLSYNYFKDKQAGVKVSLELN